MSNEKQRSFLPIGYQIKEYFIQKVLSHTENCLSYLAIDTNLNLQVVLNEFFPNDLVKREADNSLSVQQNILVENFENELSSVSEKIKQVAALRHLNLPRIIRFFHLNNTAYTVIEYEPGETLDEYLVNGNSILNEKTLLRIFKSIFAGLAKAHSENIYHAGISSSSIYLRESGEPFLTDFLGGCQKEVTLSNNMARLPDISHQKPSVASNIYSCGAVMYRCVTGKEPVSLEHRRKEILSGNSDPLSSSISERNSLYSGWLLSLLDRMMSIDEHVRPESAEDLLSDILRGKGFLDTKNFMVQKQLNETPQKRQHNILICGPVGSGITTAIKTLCDSFSKEDNVGSMTLDCGKINLSETENLLLYGTNGLDCFETIWQTLHEGTFGIILLIDNRRKDPLWDLEDFLSKISSYKISNIAIGVTHVDTSRTPAISYFRSIVDNLNLTPKLAPAIFSVDPRNYQDVSMLIQTLLYSQNPTLDDVLLLKEPLINS